MKKFLSLFLCALLAVSLAACGSSADTSGAADTAEAASSDTAADGEKNEIGQLADEGYEQMMSTWDNGKWLAIYMKDDTYLRVTADFPESAEEAYNGLDMMADDYYDQVNALVYSLDNVQTEDITSQVPTQEELDAYVGMTFGDLENDGYENCGYSGDEETGSYTFMYEGEKYDLNVAPEEGVVIEDMDDYSANDIRELVIGSVTFGGFSSFFLYN